MKNEAGKKKVDSVNASGMQASDRVKMIKIFFSIERKKKLPLKISRLKDSVPWCK